MPFFRRNCPFDDLVAQATSEKNVTDDWSLILDICDKAVNYEEGPKMILQAITKRLYDNVPRVVVQALLLLDACVKNCGKRFLLEVSSHSFVAELQKLLTKIHPATVDKLKALIKKWAEQDCKDDSQLGLIPSLYYKLQSEGIQFPEEKTEKKTPAICTNPDAVSSQEEEEDIVKAISLSLKDTPRDDYSNYSILNTEDSNKPAKIELLKVRALYDFEAVEDNELTIKAGEVVVVIDKSNESWWKGTNQRGEGYFPVSFVTEDLEAPVEVLHESAKVGEPSTVSEEKIEKQLVIDEQKIELALRLLNETDPTDECPDDESLQEIELDCYAMAPLIEERLHAVDKKCTVLNSLNEEIMRAMQTFHKLTRDTMTPSQYQYYYNTSVDAAVVSQQMQESTSMHQHYQNAGSVPRTAARHVAPLDAGPYVLPSYFPNLTNLSSTQIRENVAVLAHPSPVYPPHYNVLPHKMPILGTRIPFSNVVPYGPTSLNQPVVKTAISAAGNGECRAAAPTTNCTNTEGQLSQQTVQSNPVYPNVPQHDPGSTNERNTFCDGGGTSENMLAETRTTMEVSPNSQQHQSCIMSQEIPAHETVTISAMNQVPSGPSNSNAIITSAPVVPNGAVTSQ